MDISLVSLPYNVGGKGRGGASGPAAILKAGLRDKLKLQGHMTTAQEVILSKDEEAQYGGWHKVGVAGGHLADLVASARCNGAFVLGLLADCNGVLGMLGGLQRHILKGLPYKVGLVWIDAHGDYNTPETSPSGMLGGMPVAVASGKCLHQLRKQNKLKVPLQPPDIAMVGMRDLDVLERRMMEDDELLIIREKDLIDQSQAMHDMMINLSERQDIIYIHIDLDILDPKVAPAAGLPSRGGLTGKQLGEALRVLMTYPKVQALAVVSYNADIDEDNNTLDQVMEALLLGTQGLIERP